MGEADWVVAHPGCLRDGDASASQRSPVDTGKKESVDSDGRKAEVVGMYTSLLGVDNGERLQNEKC